MMLLVQDRPRLVSLQACAVVLQLRKLVQHTRTFCRLARVQAHMLSFSPFQICHHVIVVLLQVLAFCVCAGWQVFEWRLAQHVTSSSAYSYIKKQSTVDSSGFMVRRFGREI
jgi:hypothetical protein